MDQFYRILELEPGASINQIKAARKELLQVWHPDRFQHHPKLAAKALQKTKEINEAYEKLIDFVTSGLAYEHQRSSRPNTSQNSKSHGRKAEPKASAPVDEQFRATRDRTSDKEPSRETARRKPLRLTLTKSLVLRFSVLFIVVASIFFCATVLLPRLRSYLNDRNRWLVAAELNTASGYRDYLTALPDGRWRIDAGKGIENLYEQAMQHYQVSRSAGWNVQASGAVLTVLEYAKRSQRPEVYVDFVRHQQTTLPYTNIKASQDEAQTFSELRARLISMFPEDILRLVQGNPGESAPYLLITYTVASGSSEYVAEDPSTDPFISLGDGPIGHHSIRLDWGCEVRVPERGTIYRYAFVTKPRARLGMSKSVYDSDSIYHAMFFDCFFAFRRDLIQRLGIFI